MGGNGNVYVGDSSNNRVLKEDLADPPSLSFASAAVGTASSDSPKTVTLENVGNAALSFAVPATGNNPSISANFALNSTGATACPLVSSGSSSAVLAAGASCSLPISFTPSTTGAISGALVLTDNALNASGANQSIALGGTGTTGSATPATLLSPTPGSTLGYSNLKFTWTAGYGVANYALWAGTSGPGSSNLYSSGTITATSTVVPSLPLLGTRLYVRLFSYIGGVTEHNDYTFTLATPVLAAITSPAPGSTLGTANVTFTWTSGYGVTKYNLLVGTNGPGSTSIYASGLITATSATVPTIPASGQTVYVTLNSTISGAPGSNSYTYTEK